MVQIYKAMFGLKVQEQVTSHLTYYKTLTRINQCGLFTVFMWPETMLKSEQKHRALNLMTHCKVDELPLMIKHVYNYFTVYKAYHYFETKLNKYNVKGTR